jgi:hypothetical protein
VEARRRLKGPYRLLSPTSRLTRKGRARRRYNCGKQGEWDERAEAAVALLAEQGGDLRSSAPGSVRIADLGAGNERLRSLLQIRLGGAFEYHPFDLHPQLPTTQQLDVVREMPADDFDVAICLGLLEYLPSVPDLARRLKLVCRFAVVSYVISDSPVAIPEEDRLRHGWITHLTAAEVEAAFVENGFSLRGGGESDGQATRLWLWANPAAAGSGGP